MICIFICIFLYDIFKGNHAMLKLLFFKQEHPYYEFEAGYFFKSSKVHSIFICIIYINNNGKFWQIPEIIMTMCKI